MLFVTTLRYYFIVFPSGTEILEFLEFLEFFIYGVITDVSYISIFYSFLPPLVCYAFQSIATFTRVLSFILVFTAYVVWPSSLEIKKIFNK